MTLTDIDNEEEDNTVLSRDEENNTEEEKEEEAEQEEETGDKVMPILEPHRYDADESDSDDESVPDATNDNPSRSLYNSIIGHFMAQARDAIHGTDRNPTKRCIYFGRKKLVDLPIAGSNRLVDLACN